MGDIGKVTTGFGNSLQIHFDITASIYCIVTHGIILYCAALEAQLLTHTVDGQLDQAAVTIGQYFGSDFHT
ncbi:hypothetical protein D3C80_1437070 [compost metagenome]